MLSVNLGLVLRIRWLLLMVVVWRHCRVVSWRMLQEWLRNMAFRSPLLEIFSAWSWRCLWLLSGGGKELLLLLLLLLRRGCLRWLLLLLLLLDLLVRPLPRQRPRRGALIRTHHVRGLKASLRRRLRLMIGVVVRREWSNERLLRLGIGIIRPSSASRRGRRRGLLVEIPGCRARSGSSSAPAAGPCPTRRHRGQLVAVVIDAARWGLLAVVVAQVVQSTPQ